MGVIKTREVVKGTVKTLDRAAIAADRVRSATIRTKESAENSTSANEASPEEYGANRVENATSRVVHEGAYQLKKRGSRGGRDVRKSVDKMKEGVDDLKEVKDTVSKKWKSRKAAKSAKQTAQGTKSTAKGTAKTTQATGKGTIKTAQATGKGTVKTAQATGKGTVKAAQKGVKTAQQTGKAAVKTAKASAKATKAAAKAAAKAAQAAARAAKVAAKATVAAIKIAVKVVIALVKMAIAAVKGLVALIAAGGWVAVVIIIVICLIALIIGGCFGIFFSGEDSGTGQTMQTAVQDINGEYQARIDEIISDNSHDELEMSGATAAWKNVLAVYAVKVTTDETNAQEVATMDDAKKDILMDIFWDMNTISHRKETVVETVVEYVTDSYGNVTEVESKVETKYLYITVSHKTPEEMAEMYGFNEDQTQQLRELLAAENDELWSAATYGIHAGDEQIVSVALSQVGNVGGQPYWSWYGFPSRVEWCACFVSWCANECGYLDSNVIPKFAGCDYGMDWFKDRGYWADRGAEPTAGMIIFFDWMKDGQDGSPDHVGIVQKVENGIVYTIEGNSGDSCRINQYSISNSEILGYGIPQY